MPVIVVPAFVKVALGTAAAAAVVTWVVKEVRRINEELDRIRAARAIDPAREALPTLRRDPQSGEWRIV